MLVFATTSTWIESWCFHVNPYFRGQHQKGLTISTLKTRHVVSGVIGLSFLRNFRGQS